MHTQRTDISTTEIKLTITADAKDLAPIKDGVVARLAKNVKLPGFRDGKAPAAMAEKSLDQNLLQGDFLDEAMTQLYAQATREENIRPVTRPEVTVKKFVPYTELEFDVTTHIVGKVTVADYTKISVPKAEITVTAKDITGVLNSLKTRMATKEDVTRAAKLTDEVTIDFKGVDTKGAPIDGADGTDYPLVLGSNAFIPGFEEEVVGIKVGEEKTFDIVFPKDYGVADLANQTVTFTITAKAIKALTNPTLDDAFAASVGPFKTLDELKEDIKKQLTFEREREAETDHQNEVLRAVSAKSKVDIPDALIEQQVTYNIDEVRRNLTYKGQTYEEFLKAEGKDEKEYKESLKPQAVEQLKASLILAEVADIENITITPEELEIRIQLLKGQYNDEAMQAELDKEENRRDIASRMLSEKVINFLIEAAATTKPAAKKAATTTKK